MEKSKDIKGYDGVFATRFRNLLKERNYTQKYVAEKTHSKGQTISQYFNGEVLPNAEKLYEIAQCLKVSTDYLLGIVDVTQSNVDNQKINKELGLSEIAINQLRYEVKCLCEMEDFDNPQTAYENRIAERGEHNVDVPMFWTVNKLLEDTPIDRSCGSLLDVLGEILQFKTEKEETTIYGLLRILGIDKYTDDIYEKRARYTITHNDMLDLLFHKLQRSLLRYRNEHNIDEGGGQ